MVQSAFPVLSWDQLYEDRERALEQTPMAREQLPAYSEAINAKASVLVTEKEPARKQSKKPKSPERWATLKGILTGEVHKHNPRYVLEESHTGKPSAAREPRKPSSSSTVPTSTSTSTSTLKSILTGEVHKHNPRYVLEESHTGKPSLARERRKLSST